MLHVYYNGLKHDTFNITELTYNSSDDQNTTQMVREITIKGTGTLVPAFAQISPGKVDRNSSSNLTVTRLYLFNTAAVTDYEIFRLFNEPYFPYVIKKFSIGWTEFYQAKTSTNTSALVTPSDEPDLGGCI